MSTRFELRRLTRMEWVIIDGTLSENDPDRTVACIYEVDELEYDAIWLRELDLARTYASPQEVLAAVIRASGGRRRSQRPVPIAHVPPADDRIPA